MKVTLNFADNELPIWNRMWATYVPVQKSIANLGLEVEEAWENMNEFLKKEYDGSDLLKVMAYAELVKTHQEKTLNLAPFLNQWIIARHGISLN